MTSPAMPTKFATTPSPASIALLDGNFGFAQGSAPFWGLDNFGAVGDGATDDSAAINAWLAQLAASGGVGVMTAGKTYYCASQAVLNLEANPAAANILIMAHGAVITTGANALYGLLIQGNSVPNRQTLMGLTINQRGAAGTGTGSNAALGGIGLSGTGSVSLVDCSVIANGVPFTGNVQSDYAAIDLFQTDPTNTATGCFWTEIYRCWVRKESGSDVGDIPFGVRLRGAANSTRVQKCQFSLQNNVSIGLASSGILITNPFGQISVANGVVACFNDFEGSSYAVQALIAVGGRLEGFEAFGNRFESIYAAAYFFNANSGVAVNVPPQIWGGYQLFGPVNFSGTGVTSSTSNVISGVSSSTWDSLIIGQNLQGSGIPLGAVVTAFSQSAQTITISSLPTTNANGVSLSSQVMWISNPNAILVNNFTPDSVNVPGSQWVVTNYSGMTLSALGGSSHAISLGITANSNRGILAFDIGSGNNAQFLISSNQWGSANNCIDFQAGIGASPRDLRLRSAYNIMLNNTSDGSNYAGGHLIFDNNASEIFGHLWMDAGGMLSFVTQTNYVPNLGSDSPSGRLRLQSTANGLSRPTAPIIGQMFFDGSLATPRPIWCKAAIGPVWVDATGATV